VTVCSVFSVSRNIPEVIVSLGTEFPPSALLSSRKTDAIRFLAASFVQAVQFFGKRVFVHPLL
jgi:hypothetical protein